jgi:hypothetical protein
VITHSQRGASHTRWAPKVLGALSMTFVLAGTLMTTALAAPATYINLTTAGATVNHTGSVGSALYVQGGSGAGTGQFDPFLSIQSNADTEKGYNTTDASAEFDTFTGADRTHPLQAAAIPPVTIGGVMYREFSLDANDQGADDWMSIDALQIFLDNQNDLTGFNKVAGTFSSDTGTTATKIYDQGDAAVLMRSQTLTPGSGVSDITVFVPDALFPANCFYGSLTCNQWVYFYSEAGFLGTTDATGTPADTNWNVTAGFEEWRTRLLPVVNVSKTVALTQTRTFDWTIVKEVSIDGGTTWVDSASVDLFNGQSKDYLWRITYTKSAGTISNPHISGTITITNPTGGVVISSSIDAIINSVSDVLPAGTAPSTAAVSCGVSFPHTLKAQQTLNCTYSADPTTTADGTNTANVVVENGTTDLTYSGTAPVVWASATTTDVDGTATINDPNFPGFNGTVSASGSSTSSTQTYTCGSDATITNTANLTENTSGQTRSDSASLTIDCHGLTVDKTVVTAKTRDFDWTITKQVSIDGGTTWLDSASVDLFNGQSQNYLWKITWTKDAGTDSDFDVSGTITVSNAAPIAAVGVTVTDLLSIDGAAPVICPSTTVPAGGSLVCTYSKASASGATQTNTATATLAGNSYSSTAKLVDFSGATLTLIDDTATIADAIYPGFDGTVSTSGSSTSTTQTFTCGQTTTITNTVNLTEDDSGDLRTDSASLTVTCHGLTVDKTVATTLTRTWTWTINKSGETDALTLNIGETFADFEYSVVVNATSADSNWGISGTITISNAAPIAANGVSVTDLLSISGAATVDCDPGAGTSTIVNVPAGGTATCSYSSGAASGADQTNTATATLAGNSYSSTAKPVSFASAIVTKVDDCINVVDSVVGALGTACANETLPKTFTYTVDIGPYTADQCGENTVNNTATFTTDDRGITGSASWTVIVTIPCPTGCTLTQGYWKTHSSFGPAPEDPTWTEGSFGPTTPFFTSGKTYYQVMWTSPKGGNTYYILAHQYIAALLNIEAGAATTPAVDAAITFATNFFSTHSPNDNLSKTDRAAVIAAAGTLGSYNEGLIGPGHCSEDSIAAAANHD